MSDYRSEALAKRIPIFMFRSMFKRPVVGFFYHVVSDEVLPHVRHLYAYKSVQQFEQDLLYLKKNFQLISYDQLCEYRLGKGQLINPSALLSFDDGCAECFSVVLPLLQKHRIPCIFFITTSLIDQCSILYRHKISLCIDRLVTAAPGWKTRKLAELSLISGHELSGDQAFAIWLKSDKSGASLAIDRVASILEIDLDGYTGAHRLYLQLQEIKEMASAGFTIGAHSIHHAKLNTLPPDTIEEEIAGSCRQVQQITGQETVPFAFPFSAYGLRYDLIREIIHRNPVIGHLFDSKGIRQEGDLVTNRIWSDPAPASGSESNLPGLLRQAYEDNFVWRLRRLRSSSNMGDSL